MFKQNDIPKELCTTHYEGGSERSKPYNAHCYSVALFYIACDKAGVKPTLALYLKCFEKATRERLVMNDNWRMGFVKDPERLPAHYYRTLTGMKATFKIVGWSRDADPKKGRQHDEHYSGKFDYAIFNIETTNGGGHFLPWGKDPWRGGTIPRRIKSIKYYLVV